MYRDDYGRVWQGPQPFTIAGVTSIPSECRGVYQVLYDGPHGKEVAYIGIGTGVTIRRRLANHVADRGNWALGRIGDPAKFSFVYYECDAVTAKQIESHVVTMRKPPFNVRPEYQHFIPSIAVH
jgi:hypothetical protein